MEKKITRNGVANSFIDMNEYFGICDSDTAKGLKSSKKKDILKSNCEGLFSEFQQEIIKAQKRKQ